METTMKTVVYAKKLRAELAKLRKKRVIDIAMYDDAVAKWRTALWKWVDREAFERVKQISKRELTERRYETNCAGFDTRGFFIGAPRPPKYPSDQRIRDIQRMLHHLGITGQSTVRVNDEDTKKYFGADAED
jgi:hypothetical protein